METKSLQVKGPQELEDLRTQTHRLNEIFKHLMQRDTDYGVVPGTQKPTLLKPGAELLRLWADLEVTFRVDSTGTDRERGIYHFLVTATASHDGSRIAEGVGYGTSLEAKYRYRWLWPSDVPVEVDKATATTRTVKTQRGMVKQYRVENENPHDQANTILKMAKKRAFVDLMLTATGASRIFTQDVEDEDKATVRAADEAEGTPAPAPKITPGPVVEAQAKAQAEAASPPSSLKHPLMPSDGATLGDTYEEEIEVLFPATSKTPAVGLRATLGKKVMEWAGGDKDKAKAWLRWNAKVGSLAEVKGGDLEQLIAQANESLRVLKAQSEEPPPAKEA